MHVQWAMVHVNCLCSVKEFDSTCGPAVTRMHVFFLIHVTPFAVQKAFYAAEDVRSHPLPNNQQAPDKSRWISSGSDPGSVLAACSCAVSSCMDVLLLA
mmetsp:Transcript_21420/g.57119  ORF Transcript_21420/g.57119 Transcript_21420/m.57119 type:complete len:99 (+) Transcript_21420:1001-1297(+)